MKNMIFLLVLIVFFCLSAVPVTYAQTLSDINTGQLYWAEPDLIEITVPEESYGLFEEPDVIHAEYRPAELEAKTSFPEYYDAREHGLITPVKDQKPYDLCWAESMTGTAEADLIKKGLADPTIDLSEVFPHYFQWHRSPDPLGLTSGDLNIWHAYESYPGYTREWINSWSSGYRAVLLLSGQTGVIPESEAPYPDADADIPNYYLDPALAWNADIAHLDHGMWISTNDTEAMKRMIMKHGSIVIAFNQNRAKYLNEMTGAYYCPEPAYTNHLVSVIGWDNNYDPSNFIADPGQGGAWLVKNSFGTDWGNGGYFWLSYADKTLSEDAFVFDFEPVDPSVRTYQYDGTVSYSYLNDPNSRTFTSANVFTAQDNETLTAVGFTTPSSYFDYDIKIYRGVKDTPESGMVFAHQSGSKLYAGFYTIGLDTPVKLSAGDRFSVVVEITSNTDSSAYMLTDRYVSYSVKTADGETVDFQILDSESNPGESWYKTAYGQWIDCWNADPKVSLGNIRIKAFTVFNSYASGKNPEDTAETYDDAEHGVTLYRTGW